MEPPARWIRRLLVAPVVPLVAVVAVTTLPLAVVAAAFASPLLPGRWRPLRVLAFTLVLLVAETVALAALAVLWVAAGCGRRLDRPRWRAAHYAVMGRYLAVLRDGATRAFGLRFRLEVGRAGDLGDPLGGRGPLIVLSRHAGPGDSFLLVDGLLRRGWRPRIVLREALRWAPAIDVGLGRLPSHFVARSAAPGSGTAAVATLAADLGPADALVLFPEGRNFTPRRRVRSIAALEEAGDHDAAERARAMRHVLVPRTGGALAALTAAPDADVLFVAHAGLEDLSSPVDLWRGVPLDAEVEVEVWRVPAAEVPRDRRATEAWLHGWWHHIDAWLYERHGPGVLPDAAVEAVEHGDEPGDPPGVPRDPPSASPDPPSASPDPPSAP